VDAEKNSVMAMRYLKEIDSGYDPVGNKQEKDKKIQEEERKKQRGSSAFKPGDGKKQCLFFL